MSKTEIIDLLKKHKTEIQQKYPVANLALFGSYARGDYTPDSDIDIMVEFNGPIGWEMVDLLEYLESLFTKMKVDLVSKDGIKPRLWPYIQKDLIYA